MKIMKNISAFFFRFFCVPLLVQFIFHTKTTIIIMWMVLNLVSRIFSTYLQRFTSTNINIISSTRKEVFGLYRFNTLFIHNFSSFLHFCKERNEIHPRFSLIIFYSASFSQKSEFFCILNFLKKIFKSLWL